MKFLSLFLPLAFFEDESILVSNALTITLTSVNIDPAFSL